MKKIVLFLLLSFVFCEIMSQNAYFKRYFIGNSGTFTYFPIRDNPVQEYQTGAIDTAYTWNDTCNNVFFSIFVVKRGNEIPPNERIRDSLLTKYMNFVKIMSDAGEDSTDFVKNYKHPTDSAARGITQLCKNAGGKIFDFRGWVNSRYIAVLYVVYLRQNRFDPSVKQLFLDGFRFAE